MKIRYTLITVLFVASYWVGMTVSVAQTSTRNNSDVEIDVGIIQRFGEDPTEQISITATEGDTLSLKFLGGDNKTQVLQTNQVTLQITKALLQKPLIDERIILSDHATFETAEDSALQWKKRGIEVEVTQPGRWQVWAKRDIYKTPLLRRLLLQSLKNQNINDPYLDSQAKLEKYQVSFVVNGNRYNRDNVEISSNKKLFRLKDDKQEDRSGLYGGIVVIQPNAYGTFTFVNKVSVETYLRGVVPYEIGPNAPQAATEAQTIIARTYALRNLRRFKADNYELCADTHCQVYRGISGANAKVDQAITNTKGQILSYNNELIDALYSSTNGGISAPFTDIWNGANRPYLKAVIDAPNPLWDLNKKPLNDEANLKEFIALSQGFNESGRNLFRWSQSSTLEQLTTDLQKYLTRIKHPLANFAQIKSMQITGRSTSGRILGLDVTTDIGIVKLQKTEVRSAFTPPRSTLFYLDPIYDGNQVLKGYTFTGGGFGHGVGLSQYGSYNLANLGWSAPKILQFYYPGTTLQPLNPSIIYYRDN